MKKRSLLLIFLAIFTILPSWSVYADVGPKPSVVLNIEGLEEEVYYTTLLSKTESTGPYSISDEPMDKARLPGRFLVEEHKELALEAWQAFRSYEDKDNFYFIEYFRQNEADNTFRWTYYPPKTFKILIYLPDSEMFISSDVYERYAFDSTFSVKVTTDGDTMGLHVARDYNFSLELLSFFARVAATILIEAVIALLFKIKDKQLLRIIIYTNVLTQMVLNGLLNIFNYANGSWAFVFHYVWMELVVFLLEAVIFTKAFRKHRVSGNPVLYAFVANLCSYVIGMGIAYLVPGIF